MKITTLIENNTKYDSLNYELGLSLLIEVNDKKILLDTGQSDKMIENGKKLGIDFEEIDSIVISHGHFDHTGGLISLLTSMDNKPNIYLSNNYFYPKYRKIQGNNYTYIGSAFSEEELRNCVIDYKQIDCQSYRLYDSVTLFTDFNRYNNFEKTSNKYFLRIGEEYFLDDFYNELCVGIETKEGLIVIVGCGHIGIANILESIRVRTGKDIVGVIGGSHLARSNSFRIDETIKYLKSLDLRFVALSHCTGERVMDIMRNEFGSKFIWNNVGTSIEI